ncbi:hypothetical protein ACH5RR_033934 [Cinchona calisaya]|uniref:DDE Tnp4 domain-containing protein n=1 Tax=Cinchona calisaya TaxID=153742 RepID=A0ABD2YEV4_9GENT
MEGNRNNRDEDDVKTLIVQGACFLFFSPYAEEYAGPFIRVPCQTSTLGGRAWVKELLTGHIDRMLENYRITTDNFTRLCEILVNCGFVAQNYRKRVLIEEAVAMTLMCLVHGHRMLALCERFPHSPKTINRNTHQILDGLCKFGYHIIQLRGQHDVHPRISNDPRFFPWFQHAIGAMDGTHILACPPTVVQMAYTNRHGTQSQNMLAICDHDMCFIYVYPGWEGSAHDVRVLENALHRETYFPMLPPGKYYLVDSAYRMVPGFLPPYRTTPGDEINRNRARRPRGPKCY